MQGATYPYTGEHGTFGLLKSIAYLEKYPQFEKIVPKLKKELELRFKDIPPNQNGIKVLGKIRYYPSGFCKYKKYYSECYNDYMDSDSHILTTLSPFKFKIKRGRKKENPKRKISPTKLIYRQKFQHLPLFYRLCAYDKVGLDIRIKKNGQYHFDEDKINTFLEKEKDILEKQIPDNIKNELLSGIRKRLFNDSDWEWQERYHEKESFDKIYIQVIVKRLLGCDNVDYASDLIIGPTLVKEGDNCRTIDDKGKVMINMDTKYRVIFPLPTKGVIQQIVENGLPQLKREYDREKEGYYPIIPPNCPVATCNFNTFNEFLDQFKDLMYSLGNPNIIKIMKKIGFKVEENKEVKEIRNVSIATIGAEKPMKESAKVVDAV